MICTCSANTAVVRLPAPKKPSPMRTARRSAFWWLPPIHTGGCGFWNGLGSMATPSSCQKRPSKVDPRLCPQRLHQPQALGQAARPGCPVRRRTPRGPAAADAETDLDSSAAELVERADRLGQLHGIARRAHEHGASQPHAGGAGGSEGHRLERAQDRRRTEGVLLRPGALEPQRFGALEVPAKPRRVERAVGGKLRDGDREISHEEGSAPPDGATRRRKAGGGTAG